MRIDTLPDGSRGVDVNQPLTDATAKALVDHGYTFAIRYVTRTQTHGYDLSAPEIDTILNAGLGLQVVQHVAPEGWSPTAELGTQYGTTAAADCGLLALPDGMSLWCDLEGVAVGTDPEAVIGYCNAWYDAVAAHGYKPGLYVGWHCGLTADELYHRLKFSAYWSAFNIPYAPVVRGFQMYQHAAKTSDLIPGFTNQDMDADVIQSDALGGTPSVVLA